jgi:membrane-bound metal-dependent hydrolase YbcI (DUF457 family)
MVMKATHRAGSLPFGVAIVLEAPVPVWARLGAAGVCYAASTVNDWDHPRLALRWHPGAIVVRWTARVGYRVRTRRDIPRWDLHRGPSHCIEWCVGVGLLTAWLAAGAPGVLAGGLPPTAPYAWVFGLGAFLGTTSHVLLDALTPGGVPFSAILNWLLYGEVWRRHAVSLRWHEVFAFRTPGVVTRVVAWGPFVREVPWFGMVRRALSYPTMTVIPVDESEPECRPGLFYSDDGGQHFILVPILYVATGGVVLAHLGVLGLLWSGLTGWSV